MSSIAYILLCHKDPDDIVAQAERLTAGGDYVAIHFDSRSGRSAFGMIASRLKGNPSVVLVRRRVRCGWGEWSLVEATLRAVRAAVEAFPKATHFYMLSGDCMPIKSAGFIHAFLDADDADYIESFDFFESDWIRTGLKEDRLIYRHPFNERTRKWLFYRFYELQKRMGWRRAIPADMQIMIGSQWWCLRRRTIEAILHFCDTRKDVVGWFRTTWIPDETFFQTLVRHLVSEREIRCRTLTFLTFTDYGMPACFYDDQYDLLIAQNFLFARKISPGARRLKAQLGALYTTGGATFAVSNEGQRLFAFLTGRGRIGRRFAPRFWEAAASIGRERTLYMLVCKKWHVAKRLAAAIRAETDLPVVEYLFNEDAASMPALGGVETTLAKRNRHRRAMVRMIFDSVRSDRLVICVDPSDFDIIRDFAEDAGTIRVLEVECDFTEDYLVGHAQRVGLAGPGVAPETLARILPTIRFDVRFESDRIRTAGLDHTYLIRQGADRQTNAAALARFLTIGQETALQIAATEHLFTD